MGSAGVIQKRFGRGGFPRVDVGDDAEIPDSLERIKSGHKLKIPMTKSKFQIKSKISMPKMPFWILGLRLDWTFGF
jgi:hypothetical protein